MRRSRLKTVTIDNKRPVSTRLHNDSLTNSLLQFHRPNLGDKLQRLAASTSGRKSMAVLELVVDRLLQELENSA